MDYSLSELSEVFTCDPDKGELYWRPRCRESFNNDFTHRMWNMQFSGKVAGGINGSGYVVVSSGEMKILVHRAIWIFDEGPIPDGMFIDHINHIRHDNRKVNLRLVTHAQNQKNQSMHSNNISGVNGVRRDERSGKWAAFIKTKGRSIRLGLFNTLEDAAQARKNADRNFCFHDNHGKDKYLDTPYVDPWLRVN
ncbi:MULTISPECIES: HNH endonuclease [Klebsiella pneumoniae complex]|mgnify:CR=1 FL=1|uniref:HNH endonuclease n=1 Tax=Klebsiella pneumoniae complex TaxID=3390273 RepID=UPI000DE608B2|nr:MULTISPECIES: HNH endonuclease [Klebsiella]MDZ0185289.1 HNH endonuclease [Klebsiella quasipneumoniae]SSM12075.1 HNH endonuclease [Klebsiella pneumoniae]HBY3954596.1 HNH endonuclease [Klebsiella quasipneumoniae]